MPLTIRQCVQAVNMTLSRVRKSVKYRAGFNIKDVDPAKFVLTCARVPALLIHGAEDNFILPKHSENIQKSYAGPCELIKPPGGHNSRRPASVMFRAHTFLFEKLCGGTITPPPGASVGAAYAFATAAEALVIGSSGQALLSAPWNLRQFAHIVEGRFSCGLLSSPSTRNS